MNTTPLLGSDRRRFVRLPLQLTVRCELLNEGKAVSTLPAALSRDISVGGLGLEISTKCKTLWEKLRENVTKLRLTFKLPGERRSCRCLARVLWKGRISAGRSDKLIAGLSFLDLDREAQRRLLEVIRATLLNRLNREYDKLSYSPLPRRRAKRK